MNLKPSTFVALFITIAAVGFLALKAHAEMSESAAIIPSSHFCAFLAGPNCKDQVETTDPQLTIQVVESPSGHIEALCTGTLKNPPSQSSACDSATYSSTATNGKCEVQDPSDSDIEQLGTWHATAEPNGRFSLTCEGQDNLDQQND